MEQCVCLKIKGSDCAKVMSLGRGDGFHTEFYRRQCSERLESRPNWRKNTVVFAQCRINDDIGGTLKALQSRRRFPKKWLGQHYMVNETVNTQVVDAAQIQSGDLVLEIGPGTGSLTEALVRAGATVVAVEKDPDMAYLITERFHESDQVQVVNMDFMKWPVTAEMRKLLMHREISLAKVVSNLPFNITTNVIKRLLPMGDVFSRVVLLLQIRHANHESRDCKDVKILVDLQLTTIVSRTNEWGTLMSDEAALRLTNRSPAPDNYRPITLLVNFFSVPEYRFKVSRRAFFPQPRVDGGVVTFDLKQQWNYPPVGEPQSFFSVVDSAFNGKRKMLRSSLQPFFKSSDIQAALTSIGLPEVARPEELTLDQFVAFYNTVHVLARPPMSL